MRQGGTISLYGLEADRVAFGSLPQPTTNLTPAANRFSVPADWASITSLPGVRLRVGPGFQDAGLEGDRAKLSGPQADANYYVRAVRVPNFNLSRSSLLELAIERARLECQFQTRADACGDPITVASLNTPSGLNGYEVTVSSISKRGPGATDIAATPHLPIAALDARFYSAEIVLLLAWIEPAQAGEQIENASAKLREFVNALALEPNTN